MKKRVGVYMEKEIVKIKNWPFDKGEEVKLGWISEPYKRDNKWIIDAYFQGKSGRRRLALDWASLHFLVKDKYYIDGDLNNSKAHEDSYIEEINLNEFKVNYSEKPWEIRYGKSMVNTKAKSFTFFKNKQLYVLPIYEVIRAILAPNRFLLNRIVEMDTLENYFTYDVEDDFLNIHFTGQYSRKLLKSEKINQLAWMITNSEIFKMFNSVSEGLWSKGEIKLESLFNELRLIVRLEKREKCIQIIEILGVKKKKINTGEINIYHPSLEESISSNEAKIRKYVGKTNTGEVEVDSTASGASQAFDEVNTSMEHEYVKIPRVNKLKTGRKVRRDKEDSGTKKYLIDNGELRTLADEGGQDLIKGLEFSSIEKVSVKGELEEFVEMLRLLEKEPAIARVDIIVGDLPGDRAFSKLDDGITKRRYAIGKVTMVDGRECSLIEIEREDKALSMLLLKASTYINWEWVYSELLIGLVNESGKWSNKIIDKLLSFGMFVKRNRHIKKKVYKKERQIYNSLC